ncbi:MAG: hypothetical protein ACFB0B_03945 [Thermonemataceae bacterium]
MRPYLFYLTMILIVTTNSLLAQSNPYENDVKTIDALIKASYEIVSGEKGAQRNWERDTHLHHPKVVYSYLSQSKGEQLTMTLKEFQQATDEMVAQTAFYESEVNREVRVFGNMAQVWSTYETRLEKGGKVVRRGINSLQLIYENNRWYIISWVFCGESENTPIPRTFDKN